MSILVLKIKNIKLLTNSESAIHLSSILHKHNIHINDKMLPER